MATNARTNTLPNFFANAGSGDAIRRQLSDGPLTAASQASFRHSAEALDLLSALPMASAAAQRRELVRLRRGGDDGRAEMLETSIQHTLALHESAGLGMARARRTLSAISDGKGLVHGFVSDADLRPLRGIVVTLTMTREGVGAAPLSVTTDADGYFALRTRRPRSTASSAQGSASLSAQIEELLYRTDAGANRAAAAGAAETSGEPLLIAELTLFDPTGALLHRDPSPMVIDNGTAYREYVIGSELPIDPRGRYPQSDPTTNDTTAGTKNSQPANSRKATGTRRRK
jgi:hypothetical protein